MQLARLRMKVQPILVLLAVVAVIGLGGCTQQKVDDLENANRALNQRVVDLEHQTEALQSTTDALRQRAQDAESRMADSEKRRMEVQAKLNDAMSKYSDLADKLNNMDVTMLPPDLDQALSDLAAKYPDILTYDSKKGMVQFVSDVTFDLGSNQLKSAALDTVAKLAAVLKSAEASGFEVHVIGHTDNVPIKNIGTREKFPTNMYLAAGRAISVRDALVKDGIAPDHVMIGGWGEFRPVVPNPPTGGARANRRVEVYIVPYTGNGSTAAAAPAKGSTTPKAAPPPVDEGPLK